MNNLDEKTVIGFEEEWCRFDQSAMSRQETERLFRNYFEIFPWRSLPSEAEGFDMGCGSGRWARLVAPRVGKLHCIDPSGAITVARRALAECTNVVFHQASVDSSGLLPASQDFGYSLGVLHHVPNTLSAIRSCVELLKPNAPLLLYLYYAFDNRPGWYRISWQLSDLGRRLIHRLPSKMKHTTTDLIALLIYWPLARLSGILSTFGFSVDSIPLSFYRDHSFYTMRTDALDRFGTPLEQRFTRVQIERMMRDAGLRDIKFSESMPFWCAVGFKA